MQLRFKIQQYQVDATRSVTDVFAVQPNTGATYLEELFKTFNPDTIRQVI